MLTLQPLPGVYGLVIKLHILMVVAGSGEVTNDFHVSLESLITGWPNFPGSSPRKVSAMACEASFKIVHSVHRKLSTGLSCLVHRRQKRERERGGDK